MTSRVCLSLAAGAVVLGVGHGTPVKGLLAFAGQPQTFRTGTDVVLVDVSVRDGGRAVPGLRAEDFVLTDNGVRQRIDNVEATAVPIDVTLVVDVSGNARAGWETRPAAARAAERVREELSTVTALLRPEDRVRAFAIDTNIQEVVPVRAAAAGIPPVSVEAGGLSSLYDTLVAALLQPVEPARRHVVIARTKGVDSMSTVDAASVRAVAERSDALLHVVMMQTAGANETALSAFQCGMMGFCWPTRSFWIPHQRRMMGGHPVYALLPDGDAVAAGATATGGALHRAQLVSEPSLASAFRKAFEDFRSSYVLRYTLQGVPRGGWHTIEVSIPRKHNYTVRARKGYLVETPEAPVPDTPLPARLRSVSDFTTAYERGAYRQVATSLRQMADPSDLLRDFQDNGNPWPGNPRREAALLLEIAEPGLFASRRETRQAAIDAIDRYSRLIRHPLEADTFERYWYFALLTTLEGSLNPTLAEQFVSRALERFPDEPRFVLSRAIVAEQRWSTGTAGRLPPAGLADEIQRFYQAAIAIPSIATEARIRFAWFLHATGRRQEARDELRRAGEQPLAEPALRYLHHLLSGHVAWAMDQRDDAVAHFRSALVTVRDAQSARVALMNALLLQGDVAGAEALSQQVQTEGSADMDPWWMYRQGQYRLQPQAMARVRELSR